MYGILLRHSFVYDCFMPIVTFLSKKMLIAMIKKILIKLMVMDELLHGNPKLLDRYQLEDVQSFSHVIEVEI